MEYEEELKKYISVIHYLAKRMYLESSVCDKEDLVQAGMIGLMDALEHFDEEKAAKFKTKKSSYVTGCIRRAMMEETNKFYGAFRLPHRKKLRLNAFKRRVREGDPKEIIQTIMDMGDNEYNDLMRLSGYSRRDTVQIPHELEDKRVEQPFNTSSDLFSGKGLNEDEQKILHMRLIQSMTYTEIGVAFGVKRETMRKRVINILNRLKQDYEDKQ